MSKENYWKQKNIEYWEKRCPESKVSFTGINKGKIDISVGKYSQSSGPIDIYAPNPKYKFSVTIGSFTHIGRNLSILISQNHTPECVSNNMQDIFLIGMSEVVNDPDHLYVDNYSEKYGNVNIGSDVWIGNDVIIRGGLTIGPGSIIGARAIVTRDV